MIHEFIYPSEYEPPTFPPEFEKKFAAGDPGAFPITPAAPTSIETRNLGLTATLKADQGRKDALDLHLEPTFFQGFVNYGNPIRSSAEGAFGKPVEVILSENRILMPVFSTARLELAPPPGSSPRPGRTRTARSGGGAGPGESMASRSGNDP